MTAYRITIDGVARYFASPLRAYVEATNQLFTMADGRLGQLKLDGKPIDRAAGVGWLESGEPIRVDGPNGLFFIAEPIDIVR